ncbi:MAG: hypothetical protein IM631_12495 [Cytophagales bacterium]|nr:hypothetical protein [Cytophagales bacterium]MCA6382334.1 hypothetical protein [Cytophagales bacterium]
MGKISVAIGFEFEYAGKKYEHTFWSLPDLDNYFRWEPGRGSLVGYGETINAENQPKGRSSRGLLRLIVVNQAGARIKQKEFYTYQSMVAFITDQKIIVANASGRKGLQIESLRKL